MPLLVVGPSKICKGGGVKNCLSPPRSRIGSTGRRFFAAAGGLPGSGCDAWAQQNVALLTVGSLA